MERNRWMALLLAAAILIPQLPRDARAQEAGVIGKVTEMIGTEETEATDPQAWEFNGAEEKSVGPARTEERQDELRQEPEGPRLYFGQLHGHTADSDGTGTAAEAYALAAAAGLDFFAVTDHSNALDGAENGQLSQDASAISECWRQGKEAAVNASSETFLGLYGFEMSWVNGLGHIGTLFTPGFQTRNQDAFSDPANALEHYYAALASVSGSLGIFCHPGTFHGDFENFGHYSEEADAAMQLIEVSCEGDRYLDAYTRALDKGWHVAPVSNPNTHGDPWEEAHSGRTVVYADALTETAFAEALQNHRVYATEDNDLEILFSLEGHSMGTELNRRNVGDTVTLTASVTDPSDPSAGMVEVIVNGGTVAAAREVTESAGALSFTLSPGYSYYYLRVTQPDGDVAVTAPVWIDQRQSAQITAFTTDTALAVQNRPVRVRAEVENRDSVDFLVEQVTFTAGDQVLHTITEPQAIRGNSGTVYEADLICECSGLTELYVTVSGTIGGDIVECAASLTLTFLTEDLVTTIVADGSHGDLPPLTELEAMAAQHRMVLVQATELSAQLLAGCDIMLIPAPREAFDEEYIRLIRDYLASGRTVILWGQADRDNPDGAARLNALASALGLTGRFRDDTAYDPVNNGGEVDELCTAVYNKEDAFSRTLSGTWLQTGGCTVDPGTGVWLVKGMDTAFSADGDGDGSETTGQSCTLDFVTYDLVTLPGEATLLAREESAFGGNVFLCGGMFPADEVLDPGGSNVWDEPNGNGRFLEILLEIPGDTLEAVTIAQAKQAADGTTVRIQGFVTAGTAVEGNAFPNMIYVQDETGGLAVADFTALGVSVGTPVELYLRREKDSFRLLHWQILDGAYYNYQPKALGCKDAANYAQYADLLVSCEGRVVSRTLTEDGRGLSAFTMEDREGNRVTVLVEDSIRSASTGENTLAETVTEGVWVCAVGIVYRVEGQTVLRVRNCDEITAVRETGKTYRVVRGEYTVWIRKDGKSVYMEVEGPGEEFLGIDVDGERISQSHYQTSVTEEGNLLFRFWPRYLRTLDLGSHSVLFRFRDGTAEATLVVWNYADSPYTGDPILVYGAMMILSGGLLLIKKRRW